MEPVSQRLRAKTFDQFYREHYQMVYRTAYNLTRSRAEAEDICQTVFTRVLCRDDQTELAQNVKGYLYRAAVNEAMRVLQARGRQESLSDSNSEEPVSESTTVLEDEMHAALRDAVAKLKPEYVQIVALHYEEGYSAGEIAKRLGMSRIKVAVS